MVRLFSVFYTENKDELHRVMSYLQVQYSAIWIPGEIKDEFFCKRNDRGRKRRLKKIQKKYPFIVDCPIKVTQREMQLINGINEENNGEADAIMQCNKAKSQANMAFREISFLTNDNGAANRAEDFHIEVLRYQNLRNTFLETGIVLPN